MGKFCNGTGPRKHFHSEMFYAQHKIAVIIYASIAGSLRVTLGLGFPDLCVWLIESLYIATS